MSHPPTASQVKHGKIGPSGKPYEKIDYGPRPAHIVSVTTLVNAKGKRLCGAVLRTPGQHDDWLCHQWGLEPSFRCRMHGGVHARKPQIHNLEPTRTPNSRRNQLMEDLGLSDKFAHFRNDPKLAELHDELAMVDIEIEKAWRRIQKADNPAVRKEFVSLINARRKLVDSMKKNDAAMIPVGQATAFMYAMVNLMFEFLPNPTDKGRFLVKLRTLSGRPAHQLQMPQAPDSGPAAQPPTAPQSETPSAAREPEIVPEGEGV